MDRFVQVSTAEMQFGQQIEGFYVLKDAFLKTTTSGKPFLSGNISDKSGTIEIKSWDYTGPVGSADAGKIVKVRGEVTEYKGTFQLTVDRIRLASDGDVYDVTALVPTAPINVEKTFEYLKNTAASLEDPEYRALCEKMLADHAEALKKIPAAKSVHHSFLSGLLMHTANMVRTAEHLAGVYPKIINRSLLITGTILHDFAKEEEFTFSELGTVSEYSVRGDLLGHLVMGAQNVAKAAAELGISEEKSLLLQHMILSHHGEPERGAAVVPKCAEAELLSLIDMIDSRMEIYAETLAEVEKGHFSGRVFALDKKLYRPEA